MSYGGDELLSTKTGTEATGVAEVLDRPEGTHLYERVEGGVEFYRSLEEVEVEFGKHGATQRSLNVKPGDVWVDVYTDFQAEGSTDTDADYLARGIWVYVPDDATNLHDYEYGAFADGNDPFVQDNLAALAGTATYIGEDSATGLYANAKEQQNEFFEADVTLTANFGYGRDLGSIEGRIHDIETDGSTLPGNPRLMLRSANIGASHSGFFEGDTGMMFEGKLFSGKWGGQFFNSGPSSTETPGSVAGTFGAATEDGRESFLGGFNAYGSTTPPPIMLDYTKPSHDLQASAVRTNWRVFRRSEPGTSIAYGDFDGDGDEDVFFSPARNAGQPDCFPHNYCFTQATPVEMWENDDNNFVLNTQKFFDGNVPEVFATRKALTGDFNGDGKLDIFLATHGPIVAPPLPREEPPVLILSTENGLVQTQGLDDFVGFNHGAASADIDQDGDLDIFVTDDDSFFLVNDGNGNFERNTSAVPSTINEQAVFTAELVDVDNDGFPDLLVGGHDFGSGAAPTAIYWGNSSGEYNDSSKTILPSVNGQGVTTDIDVGDLDGDGNKDIVVHRTAEEPFYVGYYIQVISGLGNRMFSDVTDQNIEYGADATGRWIIWLRLVDVNGDGSLDITTDGDRYFGVTWLNDGSGRLAPAMHVHRPFLHDWIQKSNGLGDAQIRKQMNALVRSSDLMLHVDMGSAPTMDPVSGTVDLGVLEHGVGVTYQEIHGIDGAALAIGYRDTASESYLGYGGWIDHSAFSLAVRSSLDAGFHADAYSLGVESGTGPVSGSATWNGPVIGVDTTVFGRGRTFRGFAEINVDFAKEDVDVAFTVMRFHMEGNVVRPDITWNDLPLSDGKFGSDSIQGAFYGPNHEEVGGVFSRDGALGAFGGTRE